MHNTNIYRNPTNNHHNNGIGRYNLLANCTGGRPPLMLILVITIIIAFVNIPSHATTNVGTAGAQFLKIGPGARVDSLGGAFSAIANDVTTIYWNPAGLIHIQSGLPIHGTTTSRVLYR